MDLSTVREKLTDALAAVDVLNQESEKSLAKEPLQHNLTGSNTPSRQRRGCLPLAVRPFPSQRYRSP